MPQTRTVRLGNAGGYWGDDLKALQRQLELGPLDYISLDFLAEITMSILQKQRARDSQMGYARDFVDPVRNCLPLLTETGADGTDCPQFTVGHRPDSDDAPRTKIPTKTVCLVA